MHRRGVVLLCALLGVGVAMAAPSLNAPWFWDDYYQVREYSTDEIVSTLTGTNDPAGFGLPGYRPLQAATNHARFEVLGDHPWAHRALSVLALVVAFTLLAVALERLGVPLLATALAALLTLTSKNLTYLYAWPTLGYQTFQILAFGATVACAGLGLGKRPSHRRSWIVISLALWAITLMIRDQGVFLAPTLVLFALLAASGGLGRLAEAVCEPGASMASQVMLHLREAWNDVRARRYVLAVVGLAIADLVARSVFVPEAGPLDLSLQRFALALTWTVTFPGSEDALATGIVYIAIAVAGLMLWITASRRLNSQGVTRPWLLAGFSLSAAASSVLFGLSADTRADLVYFPLFFYALFIVAICWLGVELLRNRPASRRLAMGAIALVLAASVAFSIRASFGLQDSFGRWSVQTLAGNYEIAYLYRGLDHGREKRVVPEDRLAEIRTDLEVVGITRRMSGDHLGRPVPSRHAFDYLYCRALADPGFPAYVPRILAWGNDAFRTPDCRASS